MTHPDNCEVEPGQPQQYEEFRSEQTPNGTRPEHGGPQSGPVRPPSDAKVPPEELERVEEHEPPAKSG